MNRVCTSIWHSICNLSGILCDVFGSRRAQLHPELAISLGSIGALIHDELAEEAKEKEVKKKKKKELHRC